MNLKNKIYIFFSIKKIFFLNGCSINLKDKYEIIIINKIMKILSIKSKFGKYNVTKY